MLDLAVTDDVAVLSSKNHLANRLLVAQHEDWGHSAALKLVPAPHVKNPIPIHENDKTVAYTIRTDGASVRVLRYPLT